MLIIGSELGWRHNIHHRQPMIHEEGDFEEWLDAASSPGQLMELAGAGFDGLFERWPVSRAVNTPGTTLWSWFSPSQRERVALSANMPETPAPRGISVGRGGENR